MRNVSMALVALAAGIGFAGASVPQAAAAPLAKPSLTSENLVTQVRHHRRHGFKRGFHHRRFHHRGFRRHHFWRPRIIIGGVGRSCYYLKRRAIRSGSGYWWRRYNACRYGY